MPSSGQSPSQTIELQFGLAVRDRADVKDLKLALDAAQDAGSVAPRVAAATQLYLLFAAKGYAATDVPGVIKMLRGEQR